MSQVTAAADDLAAIKAMIGNPYAAGVQLAYGVRQAPDLPGPCRAGAAGSPENRQTDAFLRSQPRGGPSPGGTVHDAIAIDQYVVDAIVAGGNRFKKLSWFDDLYCIIEKKARRAIQGTFSNAEVFLDPQAAQLLSAKLSLLFSLMGCDERASPDSFITFHAAVSSLIPGASEESQQALAEIEVDAICEFIESYSKILRERLSNFIWSRAFLSEDAAARIRLKDFREQALAWDRFECTVPWNRRGFPISRGAAQPAGPPAKRARVDDDDDEGDEPVLVTPKKKEHGETRRAFTLAGETYSKTKATAALRAKGIDEKVRCWCVQFASSSNPGIRFTFCTKRNQKGHGSATSPTHVAIDGVTGCGADTKQLLATCRQADFQRG